MDTSAKGDIPNLVTLPIAEVFPNGGFSKGLLQVYERPWETPHLKTPIKKPGYVWRPELLRNLLSFWFSGARNCKFIGHTGTGKTELVEQFFAAMNYPLISITGNPGTEAWQLLGWDRPGKGWVDGPVLTAARTGWPLLINEKNLIPPEQMVGCNDVLDGRDITIIETGEVVRPKATMRALCTTNPRVSGYKGRHTEDVSESQRWQARFWVDYPSAEVEQGLVLAELMKFASKGLSPDALNHHRDISKLIAQKLVKGVASIRDAFMGTNDKAGALPVTLGTGQLVNLARWVALAPSMNTDSKRNNFHYALDVVIGNELDAAVNLALHTIFHAATGEPPTT